MKNASGIKMMKVGVFAIAVALACALFSGCGSFGGASATSEQQANRSYMSQVNELMEELDSRLDSFIEAVSRNDVVNMRTQADDAYQVIDQLKDLEAPENLSDVKEKYVDGCDKLREALDMYITLYTEMNAGSFDISTYDSRVADIQKTYDEGVALMEEGDKTAAGKE